MVLSQLEKPSARLLKHIIRCYNRLSENPRALIALRENMPVIVKENKLVENLDDSSKKCLKSLIEALSLDH
jgi:CCR4-NOT transcription complex subunit 9